MRDDRPLRETNQPPNSNFFSDRYLWLTLLLSLPVVGPLLEPGYFWGAHDARHSVYFLQQFVIALRDGVWYPRWAPDFAFGYGYPFFNIYGPLSSYVGAGLVGVGFDLVTAVKIVFGLSAIFSGLTMYLLGRRLLGPSSGLIAALVYVYIPYHLFDLYVRAALAESVGFVFVPLVIWGFYEVVTQPRLSAILGTGLAYAGLMFTSNLLALIFTPLMGAYVATMMLWQLFEVGQISTYPSFLARLRVVSPLRFLLRAGLPALAGLTLGLGLSAIFWLPAFVEYKYVRVDQWIGGRFAFGDDFVELFQLFSPYWGFGASIPGPDDTAGFQIGVAATLLFILSFLTVPRLEDRSLRRTLFFFQGMTLLVLFLTVPISDWVWRRLPLSSFAQFPWRLLVVVAPLISVVAGVIVKEQVALSSNESKRSSLPTEGFSLPLVILSSLILLSSYPYLQAEVRDPQPTEGPVSQAALFRFQQSADELTGQTAWVQRIPNWSTLAEQVARGGEITTKVNYTALPTDDSVGVYSMEMDSVHELLWVGTERAGQAVTFFVPYYPGWQATIYEDLGPHDGNLDKTVGPVTRLGSIIEHPVIQTTSPEGWMVVPIPSGSHFLEIRFENTVVRIVGSWITGVSLLLWLGLALKTYLKGKSLDVYKFNSQIQR